MERRHSSRETLFRGAAELFAVNGFHGTGMADLERATGLSRGSIYHHVTSKDDLLFGITTEYLCRLIESGDELLGQDLPAQQRLRLFSRRVLQEIMDHLPEMTVCFRDLHAVQDDRREQVLDLHRKYEQVWADMLHRGAEEGVFDPSLVSPLAVKALLGLHHYAYIWARPNGPMSPDAIGDVFTDLVLNGLLPRLEAR
ncbi:MAG: TetR/AcrR family transcriptional regulator [Ornithinimicrobium sp.]|uniref:TetR/AcrR family transcriptional regulator n=1 Tax=Ornithinimicrobium sp. TaxID=1977084 RepID=UPI0026E059BF|nr:TetR/AcrR family transcriptional regulator [Ornithinimicrobium sp.]MDO5740182.1 TetR/AcrR family transcriptional regulator [Ornithinimicrobium sp.]